MHSDEFRAYDRVTDWSGPVRASAEEAEGDADRHNLGCAAPGGFGSAVVVTRHPSAPARLARLDGSTVWPPHGRSTGAARWIEASS